MNPHASKIYVRALLVFCFAVLLRSAVCAQTTTTGAIEGRILNQSNGTFLDKARVTVAGTTIEVLTDQAGFYRIDGLAPGEVTVSVFYTGLKPKSFKISVGAGQMSHLDVKLGGTENLVVLDPLVIQAQKDTDQKSISINEQRFAPNQKSVVSADQFGDVTEGNVGEFLKYMPGVSLEYTAADARQIILRGVNPVYTAVSIDGNRVASAASSSPNRFFELEQSSMNNVSRVEVAFTRTPDVPADALGGSVNLVTKSAFETLHRSLTGRAYVTFNSEALHLNPTPGPNEERSRKIKPGFDFTFIDPVSKNFGFMVSVLDSSIFNVQHQSQTTWTPVANGAGGTVANPFLRSYQLSDGPKNTERRSLGASFDWKISDIDTLSFRPQYNTYNAFFANRWINWNVQGTRNIAPASFGPDFVNGAPGAASANFGSSFRHKFGTTYQIDTRYVHRGPTWTIEAGTSFSSASNHYHDQQDGHFEGVNFVRYNLTENFSGITANDSNFKPSVIATSDNTTGAPFDWTNANNYYVAGGTFNEQDSQDQVRSTHLSVKRSLWSGTSIQVGGLLQDQVRDIRQPQAFFDFVGPNGKVATASAADPANLAANYNLVDLGYTIAPPFNFPPIQWPSNYALYRLYQAHPEYFVYRPSNVATAARNSRYINELVSAAYAMGDSKFLANRLRLVYGIRFERTRDSSYGFLQDLNAIYQHDSSGNVLKDAGGKPIPLTAPNGLPITDPTNAVLLYQTEYKDRGLHASRQYAAGYPSASLTYEIVPNLIVRLAYTRALGRPNFANIIPGVSLPDPNMSNQSISVVNYALEPEQADNYDAALEYYFPKIGFVSVSAFRKDFTNFFGTFSVPATTALLVQYGVPNPDVYVAANDVITSNFNAGTAHITGLQLDYKQVLDFLPMQGFSVFASGYAVHLQGSPLADFTNFISKAASAGIAYSQRRFGGRLNFNYRGTQRYGFTKLTDSAGTSVIAYTYYKPRPTFDIDLDYHLTENWGLFLAGRNITHIPSDRQQYAPEMPGYTHLFQREDYGAQYTVGVKARF